eukprot:2786319-Pyramimonas_sp.AAC.1
MEDFKSSMEQLRNCIITIAKAAKTSNANHMKKIAARQQADESKAREAAVAAASAAAAALRKQITTQRIGAPKCIHQSGLSLPVLFNPFADAINGSSKRNLSSGVFAIDWSSVGCPEVVTYDNEEKLKEALQTSADIMDSPFKLKASATAVAALAKEDVKTGLNRYSEKFPAAASQRGDKATAPMQESHGLADVTPIFEVVAPKSKLADVTKHPM